MAQFNNEIITDDEMLREKAKQECGVYLQACITKEELEKLKKDWNAAGGFKVIPWWKFAFDNITVSYRADSNEERK